jgi:hypothetical protein
MGKLQHFVGRFYLRPWAEGEKLYCLQDDKVRRDNIRNLAAENYFYRLQELIPEDVEFLRRFIEDSPTALRSAHEQLIEAFAQPYVAKREFERLGLADSYQVKKIDEMIIELNEKFHTGIEEDFRPYLASMISGDLSFLKSTDEDAIRFYRGLAVQYARTNHVKKMETIMDRRRFELYKRIANPLVHILANNVGFSLFAIRNQLTVVLINNSTELPFVAADQPVINISASPKQKTPPTRFDLYYPVSPTVAMMLIEPGGDLLSGDSSVSRDFVEMCNLRMAAHSYRQVFSNSQDSLALIRDMLPSYMSCFPG